MFNLRLIAGLLAAFAVSAAAADSYYVVVPVKGRAVAPVAVDVKLVLNSAVIPDVYVGVPFTFDVKPLLVATGDPQFSMDGVSWSGVSTAPGGMAVASNGVVSGNLTGRPGMAYQLPVTASYKGGTATRTYFFKLMPLAMSLTQATLPPASAGQAYSFDFKPYLSVNDPAFVATVSTFSMEPLGVSGIALSPTAPGVLQVSASVPPGVYSLPLTATYYGRATSTSYTLTVKAPGYGASRFYASMNAANTIGYLGNEGPGAITITDCKRTPAGGGAAVNCTSKDAWPVSWPAGAAVQAEVPTDTYYVSLDNGQKIVWQPNAKTVSMQ